MEETYLLSWGWEGYEQVFMKRGRQVKNKKAGKVYREQEEALLHTAGS